MKTMKIEGLPVKDAKKPVLLAITAGDVRKGKVKSPASCAAAVACKRQLGASEAHVHKSRTYLRFNGHWVRYMTPASLQAEIVAFDRGGKFEPGEHRLARMQHYRNTNSGPRRKAGKKKQGYHVVKNIRPMALVA